MGSLLFQIVLLLCGTFVILVRLRNFFFFFQVAETLEDLAGLFSEEEWDLLDPGQRGLHEEVVAEMLSHVVSLGKLSSSMPHLFTTNPLIMMC